MCYEPLTYSEARNELWFVLELAKTLGQSSSFTTAPPTDHPKRKKIPPKIEDVKIPDPPILPPGTYTATPSLPTSTSSGRPLHARVLDLELALAAKHQALDDCSALIDSAVEELQIMADAGDRFWRDVRALREGGWAIVPKPDFGRTGEKAKDVIIPYAVDEGMSSVRFDALPSCTSCARSSCTDTQHRLR
jgi:hypothetical protein